MTNSHHSPDEEPKESRGINLPLVYALIVLALAAAIGCALLIVAPFYRRIH